MSAVVKHWSWLQVCPAYLLYEYSINFSPFAARELATQIQKVVVALGDFMNAQSHACIGGTNVREDMRNLEQGGESYENLKN